MFEARVRDGAARVGRWTPVGGSDLPTPLLLWAAIRDVPPPADATVAYAHEGTSPDPGLPHVLARGGFVEPERVLDAAAASGDAARRGGTTGSSYAGSGSLVLQSSRRLASFVLDHESIVRAQVPLTVDVPRAPVLLEMDSKDAVVWVAAHNWLQDPKVAAEALVKARTRAGFGKLLFAPGALRVDAIALLAYAGIDAFDSSSLLGDSAAGKYHTDHGILEASALDESPCACPTCGETAPDKMGFEGLLAHNWNAAKAELRAVTQAIRRGALRELVEQRVRTDPELVAIMRRLDHSFETFELRAPVLRRNQLLATSKESMDRVECERFRQRLVSRYVKPEPARILVLFPCSKTKPYLRSPSHRLFRDAINFSGSEALVHEAMVTSPLGLVPRDLELTYPAAHYDVPVTGVWDRDEEEMIRRLLREYLRRNAYERVVAHLGHPTFALVEDLLPEGTPVTVNGRPTSGASLEALRRTLVQLRKGLAEVPIKERRLHDVKALARYQFGPEAAEAIFQGVGRLHGRWPDVQVMDGHEVIGQLVPSRGLISLSWKGAARLAESGVYTVEIEDFTPSGSVFAVGVTNASGHIRPMDEVAVVHDGQLRASGIALMSGPEMAECERGEAVKVRRHA